MSYSIGWTLPATMSQSYRLVPEDVWQPAYNADGAVREGAPHSNGNGAGYADAVT